MLKFIKTHPDDINSCYRIVNGTFIMGHVSREDAQGIADSINTQEQASQQLHEEQTNKLTEGF